MEVDRRSYTYFIENVFGNTASTFEECYYEGYDKGYGDGYKDGSKEVLDNLLPKLRKLLSKKQLETLGL